MGESHSRTSPCHQLPRAHALIRAVVCWCAMARADVQSIQSRAGPRSPRWSSASRAAHCNDCALNCLSVSHCAAPAGSWAGSRSRRCAITSCRWRKAASMSRTTSSPSVMPATTSSPKPSVHAVCGVHGLDIATNENKSHLKTHRSACETLRFCNITPEGRGVKKVQPGPTGNRAPRSFFTRAGFRGWGGIPDGGKNGKTWTSS